MKPFTEKQKKQIKQRIIKAGKQVFPKYGLKKAPVKLIAEKAEIPASTFYQFFKSKLDLYYSILREYAIEFNQKIVAKTLSNENAKQGIKDFITRVIQEIENNPLLKIILKSEDSEYIDKKSTMENHEQKKQSSIDMIASYITKWQEQGKVIKHDAGIIAGVIRSVVFLVFHKKEIGINDFDKVIEFMSEIISSGLCR